MGTNADDDLASARDQAAVRSQRIAEPRALFGRHLSLTRSAKQLKIENRDPRSSVINCRIQLEQPNHPIIEPIVHAKAGASPHGKINRRSNKYQIVANTNLMGVIRLPVEGTKIALRLIVFDRRFHHRCHRRQHFQPVSMKAERRD